MVTSGSDIDVAAIAPYADAIILAWYPGEQGGNAFADILFGKVSPSGKLPVTFYRSIDDVPPYTNYSMKGRTYRYFTGAVQYPFGYGLSYSSFSYQWAREPKKAYIGRDTIKFSVQIKNTGSVNADEVMQAYINYPNLDRMPLKELKGFKRVEIGAGLYKTISISIPVTELQKWDINKHKFVLYPGSYTLQVGNNSQDTRLSEAFTIK